ncbi:ABC transporter permease subunit [Kroppenstedtia pulmonis]|uniref:ABC transporter permease subunit n=1 Tax=Kroppenstedtia pulmonis TaxID=1380685 RepID=A0A7D3Y1J2_9BACL|nr:ABC transporter permease [Kroppenstedtia pulmonis]QKG85400.1 ABC transporter permease subunit [Kroppenstedtia pulmonis]
MMQVFMSDMRKIQGTWIPWLLVIAPFAFCSVQVVNYLTRLEILQPLGWMGLMAWTNYFWPVTLILGVSILASMLSGMEHDAKAWKAILALPLNKWTPYFSKFLLLFVSLAIFVSFTYMGLIIMGNLFGLGPTPWSLVAVQMFYPFFASIAVMVLQLWLSLTIRNQAIPLTFGILGATLSLFLAYSPSLVLKLFPWAYVPLASPLNEGNYTQWPLAGAILGSIFLIMGGLHFSKREL